MEDVQGNRHMAQDGSSAERLQFGSKDFPALAPLDIPGRCSAEHLQVCSKHALVLDPLEIPADVPSLETDEWDHAPLADAPEEQPLHIEQQIDRVTEANAAGQHSPQSDAGSAWESCDEQDEHLQLCEEGAPIACLSQAIQDQGVAHDGILKEFGEHGQALSTEQVALEEWDRAPLADDAGETHCCSDNGLTWEHVPAVNDAESRSLLSEGDVEVRCNLASKGSEDLEEWDRAPVADLIDETSPSIDMSPEHVTVLDAAEDLLHDPESRLVCDKVDLGRKFGQEGETEQWENVLEIREEVPCKMCTSEASAKEECATLGPLHDMEDNGMSTDVAGHMRLCTESPSALEGVGHKTIIEEACSSERQDDPFHTNKEDDPQGMEADADITKCPESKMGDGLDMLTPMAVDWDQAPIAATDEDSDPSRTGAAWGESNCQGASPHRDGVYGSARTPESQQCRLLRPRTGPQLLMAPKKSNSFKALQMQTATDAHTSHAAPAAKATIGAPRATLAAKAITKRSHGASTSRFAQPVMSGNEVSRVSPNACQPTGARMPEGSEACDAPPFAEADKLDMWSAPPPIDDTDAAWGMPSDSRAPLKGSTAWAVVKGRSPASTRNPSLANEIEALFTRLLLQDRIGEAARWAEDMGAVTIDELMENSSDLAKALALKPLELKRLLKAKADRI